MRSRTPPSQPPSLPTDLMENKTKEPRPRRMVRRIHINRIFTLRTKIQREGPFSIPGLPTRNMTMMPSFRMIELSNLDLSLANIAKIESLCLVVVLPRDLGDLQSRSSLEIIKSQFPNMRSAPITSRRSSKGATKTTSART